MTYVSMNIDIDLDDIDDDDLIEELESRSRHRGISVYDFVKSRQSKDDTEILNGRYMRDRLAVLLGLNELASKEDIINLLNERL